MRLGVVGDGIEDVGTDGAIIELACEPGLKRRGSHVAPRSRAIASDDDGFALESLGDLRLCRQGSAWLSRSPRRGA